MMRKVMSGWWLVALIMAMSVSVLAAENERFERSLIILTSDSLETRGMAMVLSNALQEQGQELHFLLCDSAGELAVEAHQSPELAPRGMKPEQLLQRLMANGAGVEVCALFLPNSEYTEKDLLEGVTTAQPPAVAEMMADPKVRVFSF